MPDVAISSDSVLSLRGSVATVAISKTKWLLQKKGFFIHKGLVQGDYHVETAFLLVMTSPTLSARFVQGDYHVETAFLLVMTSLILPRRNCVSPRNDESNLTTSRLSSLLVMTV